jgi:ribosomal protein S18 acetylase RimI-like enzyme
MALRYESELPTAEQYWGLFQTTGWNAEYHATPQELLKALAHSWYCLAAYDDEHLVGFGRIVTDQVLHAMIYDLIVDPDYQRQGLGSQILDRLVARCQEANIRDIQLFCARGKQAFYEKHGFVIRPTDAPGMQYRRKE